MRRRRSDANATNAEALKWNSDCERDRRCLLNSVATRLFTVTNLQDVTIFFVARETAFRDFSIANAVYVGLTFAMLRESLRGRERGRGSRDEGGRNFPTRGKRVLLPPRVLS